MIDKFLRTKYVDPLMAVIAITGFVLALVEGFSQGKYPTGMMGLRLFYLAFGYTLGRFAKKLQS